MFYKIEDQQKENSFIYGSLLYYSNPSIGATEFESLPPSCKALSDLKRLFSSGMGVPFTFIGASNHSTPPTIVYGVITESRPGDNGLILKTPNRDIHLLQDNLTKELCSRALVIYDSHINKTFYLEEKMDGRVDLVSMVFGEFKTIKNGKHILDSWISGLNYHYFKISIYLVFLITSTVTNGEKAENFFKSMANVQKVQTSGGKKRVYSKFGKHKHSSLFWFYLPPSKPMDLGKFAESLWSLKNLDHEFINEVFENKHPFLAGFYIVNVAENSMSTVTLHWYETMGLSYYEVEPVVSKSVQIELQTDQSISLDDVDSLWVNRQKFNIVKQFFIPYDGNIAELGDLEIKKNKPCTEHVLNKFFDCNDTGNGSLISGLERTSRLNLNSLLLGRILEESERRN